MASLNKVTLIGNLGKDPELRYTANQTPFARFSLATTEKFTSNGQQQRRTSWHNLVIWGKLAEIAGRYLHKGKQIFVEGKLDYREYEDQHGQRRNITDIRVDRFLMLGPAPSGGDYGSPGGGYGNQQGGAPQSYGNQGGGYGNQGPVPQQYGGGIHDADPDNESFPDNGAFSDDDIPF